MKEGLGDILLTFQARVPRGGSARTLVFANHHESRISVYLVNCLVPDDPNIRVTGQTRNYEQSVYRLDYAQAAVRNAPLPVHAQESLASRLSPFLAFFRHGIRHILTGYDHLLFVSALVLAATGLWDLIKVVSAFTIAHTITLPMGAFDLVHVPSSIIEPMISLSIVFVAVQNVFWPQRARGWSRLAGAFFFGLFHGLGFAGGFVEAMREMPSGTMLLAIFAFSIGVETGHQIVVLPLFALLRAARRSMPDTVARARLSMTLQRIGSGVISAAGVYYLCVALGW